MVERAAESFAAVGCPERLSPVMAVLLSWRMLPSERVTLTCLPLFPVMTSAGAADCICQLVQPANTSMSPMASLILTSVAGNGPSTRATIGSESQADLKLDRNVYLDADIREHALEGLL